MSPVIVRTITGLTPPLAEPAPGLPLSGEGPVARDPRCPVSAVPINSPRRPHAVAPTKFGQMLQTVQGGYYVLAGLAVALFLDSLRGETRPEDPRPGMGAIRVVAGVVAVVGAALLYSGWFRRGTFVPAGLGMWVALFLLAQGAAGMALGLIPATFLIDAAVEGLFLVLWVTVMFRSIGRQMEKTTETRDASGRRGEAGGTAVVG